MTAQDQGGSDAHWLTDVDSWPRVRFPLDSLKPHGHEFATTSEARSYNTAMFRDCGLRVLHLWLNSRDWIRRRTEAVTFLDDRTVRRQVTVDFVTPTYAPTLVVGGQEMDMVPVALLQKKSLVHFDLLDETGATLSLLGLRQQQTLTAAALKGLAESLRTSPRRALDERLIDTLVFGDRPLVRCAMQSLTADPEFAHLRADPLFLMAAERFLDNWMMVLLLPRQKSTRRILKYSFDEPLDLRYVAGARGFCTEDDGLEPQAYRLQPARKGLRTSVWPNRLLAGLGLQPVRIRFPIFSAESAQSYHLEVTAPQGAVIRAAQALASRPEDGSGCATAAQPVDAGHDDEQCAGASLAARTARVDPVAGTHGPARAPTGARPGAGNIPGPVFDQVVGAHPTVDLHLTDVRSGSFSQAQVELRAQLSGWLFSMTVACWVNTALLLALTLTRSGGGQNGSPETAVTLLVVFVSFASTVVTAQDAHPMLGRLLLHAKGLAGVSSLCALGAAAQVALTAGNYRWLWLPTILSLLCALLLSGAAFLSRPRRPDHADVSPWDFTVPMRRPTPPGTTVWCPAPVDERPPDDATARRKLHLDRPAIQVATAEGVRHRTRWSSSVEQRLGRRLQRALRQVDVKNSGRPGTRFTASSAAAEPPAEIDLRTPRQRPSTALPPVGPRRGGLNPPASRRRSGRTRRAGP